MAFRERHADLGMSRGARGGQVQEDHIAPLACQMNGQIGRQQGGAHAALPAGKGEDASLRGSGAGHASGVAATRSSERLAVG